MNREEPAESGESLDRAELTLFALIKQFIVLPEYACMLHLFTLFMEVDVTDANLVQKVSETCA